MELRRNFLLRGAVICLCLHVGFSDPDYSSVANAGADADLDAVHCVPADLPRV
jgi:hypothetical protein